MIFFVLVQVLIALTTFTATLPYMVRSYQC